MSKITDLSKTIVALATSLGTGSIAVIRIAGTEAVAIANAVFRGRNLAEAAGNTIHFGKILADDTEIDQVVVSLFKAPHSYTGEDVVELSCHANPLIVRSIIDVLLAHGAHHAGPGEFTLRAFLNGKIDLAQAEAVSQLITAKTNIGVQNSIRQLEGSLTGYLAEIKQELIRILGLMEVDLDFSEEGLEVVSGEEILIQVSAVQSKIAQLIASYNYGKLFNSAIHVVIAGSPNVGKSTLLNRMVGENRAITSQHPGTTRDAIHEHVNIGSMHFKLIDTAGLRSTADEIETAGIERSHKHIAGADLVLYLIDASKKRTNESIIQQLINNGTAKNVIIVGNKTDLGTSESWHSGKQNAIEPHVYISAESGAGIENLKEAIIQRMSGGFNHSNDEVVISINRHKEILERTRSLLAHAVTALKQKMGFEFVGVDLREALHALGEITGETATDDILNNIFKNFCIGK